MSAFGKRWMIDGVPAGPINRHYPSNGQYTVIFEREYASLKQIEGINWAQPTVEHIWPHGKEAGLPEGYGFEVVKIDYDSGCKYYKVTLKTASQYLGDVTGYQDRTLLLRARSRSRPPPSRRRRPRSRTRRPRSRLRRPPSLSRSVRSRSRQPPFRPCRSPAAPPLWRLSWTPPMRKE